MGLLNGKSDKSAREFELLNLERNCLQGYKLFIKMKVESRGFVMKVCAYLERAVESGEKSDFFGAHPDKPEPVKFC